MSTPISYYKSIEINQDYEAYQLYAEQEMEAAEELETQEHINFYGAEEDPTCLYVELESPTESLKPYLSARIQLQSDLILTYYFTQFSNGNSRFTLYCFDKQSRNKVRTALRRHCYAMGIVMN